MSHKDSAWDMVYRQHQDVWWPHSDFKAYNQSFIRHMDEPKNKQEGWNSYRSQSICESWSPVYHAADADIYKERLMLL